MQSKYACLALAAPMTLATTVTTTTPPTIPSNPWSEADAVNVLNWMYMHFKEDDDTSRMGLTISMASQVGGGKTFNDNIFCSDVMPSSCFQGQADCKLSASLLNHKVMVNGTQLSPQMSRPVGYIFNQDLVESQWGKCAYIWDGADSCKLNNGCGVGAPGSSCDDHTSAFYNQCDGHTCTRDDHQVTGQFCKGSNYGVVDPPSQPGGATCFYEMPALVYGDSTETNHLRDALKERVSLQGNDPTLTASWNEIVLDDRLLIPSITANPAEAIWAFVCAPAPGMENACDLARAMRDEFKTAYSVQGDIPVVKMDASADFRTAHGPFALAPASQIIV